jgi:probable O-glycosylation ligase (exosortase A-associated)
MSVTDDPEWVITQGTGAGATSFLSNATDFGAAMCVVFPFALYVMQYSKRPALRLVGLVSAILFVLSIVRTGSRGAAVALAAMAVVYWFRSHYKLPVGLAIVGIMAIVWISAPKSWQERFISAKDYNKDATASARLDYWKAGVEMAVKHPLLGVGMYNFPFNYVLGGGDEAIVPHSIFIQAAAELGVPGLILLLSFLYIGFSRNHQTRRFARGETGRERSLRGMADALDVSLVGFVVSGAFLTILYYPHIFVILAMIVALHAVAQKECAALSATPPATGRVVH